MKASPYCIKKIEELEAFSAEPYPDEAGHATIGYGELLHKGPPTEDEIKNLRWTIAQAEERLLVHIAKFERALNTALKVPVNQNQFDALLIWTYNCGIGALKSSSWLQAINRGEYAAVPELLKLWNKVTKDGKLVVSPGLVNRRQFEADLFMKGNIV